MPLSFLATAGFTCSRCNKNYSCPTNREYQAPEQNPFKIQQCTNIHWLSFKTQRANPMFTVQHLSNSRSVSTLMAEYLTPNSSEYAPRNSKMLLLKGNYVHRVVNPQFSLQIFYVQ